MIKRFIALFVAVVMLIPAGMVFSADTYYKVNVQYEFEDTLFSPSYEICKHNMASGRRYIVTNLSMTNSPPAKEDIVIDFNSDTEKDHYLWLRYSAPSSSGSAVHIALDGEVLSQRSFSLPVSGTGIWLWTNARTINAQKGKNTIRIASNHNGLCLDSFIVSDVETFIPDELSELNKIKAEYDAEVKANQYKIPPDEEKRRFTQTVLLIWKLRIIYL